RHLIERGRNLASSRILRRGSHTIFDVHQDGIDGQAHRLINHALAVARHEHPGTYKGSFLIHMKNLSRTTSAYGALSARGTQVPCCCLLERLPTDEFPEPSSRHRNRAQIRIRRTWTCKHRRLPRRLRKPAAWPYSLRRRTFLRGRIWQRP